jgi:hypothetical protein
MIKNKIIKVGSYTALIVGCLSAIFLLVLGAVLFFAYPDASFQKKALIAAVFLIVSCIIFLLTISLFQSMRELLVVEKEIAELEEETKSKY